MDSGVVVMGMDLFTDECQSQYRNVSPVSCESIDVHWPLRNCRIGSLQMVLRHHANLTSSVREYRWDFNYRESRGHKLCSIAWLTNRRCLDALLHMWYAFVPCSAMPLLLPIQCLPRPGCPNPHMPHPECPNPHNHPACSFDIHQSSRSVTMHCIWVMLSCFQDCPPWFMLSCCHPHFMLLIVIHVS